MTFNPTAKGYALTLPVELKGHPFLIPHGESDPRVKVQFLDITKLGVESGLSLEELSTEMSAERPYSDIRCDLVFCDGQLVRSEEFSDPIVRWRAIERLLFSQLIIAMNRMSPNGTLIMLLHKVEAVDTFKLLAQFHKFSDIQLYKPTTAHANRSSFYLVAREVQPFRAAAVKALTEWKAAWKNTWRADVDVTPTVEGSKQEIEEMRELSMAFGPRFIQLATPIWNIQRNALQRAGWLQFQEVFQRTRQARQSGQSTQNQ